MSKRINTAFEKENATLAAQIIMGKSVGSGIYVTHKNEIFFCTARHVVFNEVVNKKVKNFSLKTAQAKIKSYPKSSNFKVYNELELDLALLGKTNNISFNTNIDLCVIKIGNLTKNSVRLIKGVKKLTENINLNVANSSMIKPAKKIEIGEETYVIGYPKVLAMFQPQRPVYNYEIPLVRKGIISSMNDYKTFVIDCAVYGGNSGGPVFVAENILEQVQNGIQVISKTYLVGIVTRFIPLVNTTASMKSNITGAQIALPSLENSGYGVCIAFELIEKEINKLMAKKQ